MIDRYFSLLVVPTWSFWTSYCVRSMFSSCMIDYGKHALRSFRVSLDITIFSVGLPHTSTLNPPWLTLTRVLSKPPLTSQDTELTLLPIYAYIKTVLSNFSRVLFRDQTETQNGQKSLSDTLYMCNKTGGAGGPLTTPEGRRTDPTSSRTPECGIFSLRPKWPVDVRKFLRPRPPLQHRTPLTYPSEVKVGTRSVVILRRGFETILSQYNPTKTE